MRNSKILRSKPKASSKTLDRLKKPAKQSRARITRHSRTEGTLRQSEARNRAILEAALDAIITMDYQGRIIQFNPAAEKIFGYNRAEVMGRQMANLIIPPSLREKHRQGLARYLATGEGPVLDKRTEMTAMRADGTVFPVELIVTHIALEGPPMFTGYVRDLTQHKEAEKKLRESGNLLQTIIDTEPECVKLLAADGTLLQMNPAGLAMVEADSLDQVLGKSIYPLVAPECREAFKTMTEEVFRGKPGRLEFEIIGFKDTRRRLETHAVPLRDRTGKVISLLGITRDITERKKVSAELEKAILQLEKANDVKNQFLSVMSHELRTPLNVVMGYAGMLSEGMLGDLNPEQEKALGKVMSRSHDLLSMITTILDASRIESDMVGVEIHDIPLGEFLDQLRSQCEIPLEKEVALIWDYPSHLPVIKSDGGKLKHILLNLINNAVKFTEKGSVTISTRVKQQAIGSRQQAVEKDSSDASRLPPHVSDGWVEFKVADTGIGIAQEALPFVFERFHQADNSETRAYGGVGIGLYMAKKLTELLEGTIEIKSEPGKGSTFTVTLPVE